MTRVALASVLITLAMMAGRAQQPSNQGRRVLISADMEGVTGVVQPAQLGPAGFDYAFARELMTAEVNAAIDGAADADFREVVVADSHGNGQNLLLDRLPAHVRVVRGFPRPLNMMQGIEKGFAAAIFIGYHGSEYLADAVRAHTFSGTKLLGVKMNGSEIPEGIFNAAIAGQFDVPVTFVSGDRAAVEQLQKELPWVEGVVVKEGLGMNSTITNTPAHNRAAIREGVGRSLQHLGSMKVYRVGAPIDFEIGFKLTLDAERASFIPGLTRTSAHTVRGSFKSVLEIAKLVQVVTAFETP